MVIYYYLKFFQQEKYAREFVAGRLYLNSLGYFKGLEDGPNDGRGDQYEGSNAWLQPSQLGEIQIGGITIPASDLAGPVIIQAEGLNALNILCLWAAHSSTFTALSAENIDAFRESMRVTERCLSMGQFAVLVHSVPKFNDRILKAAKREGFGLTANLVTYFDPHKFSGRFADPVFAKRTEFEWQREYRFALDRNVAEPKPYVLDVGSLEDICKIVDAKNTTETPGFVLPE